LVLSATAVYDAARLEIPALSCALLLGTAVISTPPDMLAQNAAAAACVWTVYLVIRVLCSVARSPVPIGMGDIKLLSILALMLGALDCFRLVAAAGLLSGAAAAALLIFRKADAKSEIPFAPFIAAGYAMLLLEEVYVP
jgi:prepilin signal peptidase PulO-like enzyme (type II secretory pathway)